MKGISKSLGVPLASGLMLAVALAGCGDSAQQESSSDKASAPATSIASGTDSDTIDISKPVTISMYLIGSPGKDNDEVLAEFNKKANADLNVTLKETWIGWGDYATKYPLVLASGEPIDLIYSATWMNFYDEAQKGAFLPLETIGPKYAPLSFKNEPQAAIQQGTVNGHLYGLGANFAKYNQFGYIVRGDLMQKYGLTDIKTMDDFGTYLDKVVKNDKELDPTGWYDGNNGLDSVYLYNLGLYPANGDNNSPFWINLSTGKVESFVDRPEMTDYYQKMKEWSDKGYWSKSVLSNKDNSMFTQGRAASAIHNTDTWSNTYLAHPEFNPQYYPAWDASYVPSYMSNAMSVAASSKNPERALMLLDKIRNDPTYYNLLNYGIENKHYTLTSDNRLKPLDTDAYAPQNGTWGFESGDLDKILDGMPENYAEVNQQIESMVKDNPYVSFTLDTSSFKTEYSAILNVMQQYEVPLRLGYLSDPAKRLDTLRQQLKTAGADKVLAAIQQQVDEFNNNNK